MKTRTMTHKIPGVDQSVCCAEQMIAYNLAFRAHINDNAKRWNAAEIVDFQVNSFHREYPKSRCNLDAIHAALENGLAAYLAKSFIAWNYEQIGAAFPLTSEEVERV